MVQRSKRSMSPGKAREMQAVTKAYLYTVRRWSGEVPIGHQVYITLDVLNFALNLALSKFNQEAGTNAPDEHMRLHRSDVDAGE